MEGEGGRRTTLHIPCRKFLAMPLDMARRTMTSTKCKRMEVWGWGPQRGSCRDRPSGQVRSPLKLENVGHSTSNKSGILPDLLYFETQKVTTICSAFSQLPS